MGWAQDLPEWSALGIGSDVMSVLPSRSPKRSVLRAPMAATGVIASARIALGAGHATPHPWGPGDPFRPGMWLAQRGPRPNGPLKANVARRGTSTDTWRRRDGRLA